ncbi:crotonase/enoyl-CoA hydratase family protein [Parasphingorhabdus sp. DH2-15]|uniref:crotonase/enoyl-CoA hydratase family protein n=1 Tax=Parasphingorhabdus sp. DH2-15 TaxID=3444112 RepID=UPI003F6843F5
MDGMQSGKVELENWSAAEDGEPKAALDKLAQSAEQRLKIAPELFQMKELDCLYSPEQSTLWTFMKPKGRPSFTASLLHDFKRWQRGIESSFGPDKLPLDFLVLGSRFPGVFCYGGDLDFFVDCIHDNDRDALVDYGWQCVQILHRNFLSLDLPMMTIGLVEGDALGGGFEALLSFDIIAAERGAKFGLPESMFGLFPGMGAHSFLSRKIGTAMAERMIMGGETYTAEQLYDMGLVHALFDKGEGKAAVDKIIKRERRRFHGLLGGTKAMARASDITLQELEDIVEIWADSALRLSEHNIRLMQRLVAAQTKLISKNAAEYAPIQLNATDNGSENRGSPDVTKRRA